MGFEQNFNQNGIKSRNYFQTKVQHHPLSQENNQKNVDSINPHRKNMTVKFKNKFSEGQGNFNTMIKTQYNTVGQNPRKELLKSQSLIDNNKSRKANQSDQKRSMFQISELSNFISNNMNFKK